jgi:hypothetical protein
VELDGEGVRRWLVCWPTRAGPGADPGATATIGTLTLEAEGTTGRRNRIDTVLVIRQREETSEDRPREERQTADA